MSKHYSAADFEIRYKEVFLGNRKTGFSVVPSEIEGMWHVSWPDGILSEDHYNLTRAKEHAVSEAANYLRHGAKGVQEPVGCV